MNNSETPAPPSTRPTLPAEMVLELLGEDANVSVRTVERAGIRVQVQTSARLEQISTDLTEQRVEIERVAINRRVDAAPPVREEDGVTIISVVEEVAVTEVRLVLKEEIHLRRVSKTVAHHQTIALREQHAQIDRLAPTDAAQSDAA